MYNAIILSGMTPLAAENPFGAAPAPQPRHFADLGAHYDESDLTNPCDAFGPMDPLFYSSVLLVK